MKLIPSLHSDQPKHDFVAVLAILLYPPGPLTLLRLRLLATKFPTQRTRREIDINRAGYTR